MEAVGWEGLKVRRMGSAFSFLELYADDEQLMLEARNLKMRRDGAAAELSEKVTMEETKSLP